MAPRQHVLRCLAAEPCIDRRTGRLRQPWRHVSIDECARQQLLRRQNVVLAADQVTFLVFAPLAFVVIRLTVSWRWKTVLLAAAAAGVAADAVLDLLMSSRL